MSDFSIDLETLGNRPYSVIIAIGICKFDRTSGEVSSGQSLLIDPDNAVDYGLNMDPSTVLWWMNQSDAARQVFQPGKGMMLPDALQIITNYLAAFGFDKQSCIWGNGSGFDVNLLENAYEKVGLKCPWNFWQARDMRTVVDLAGVNPKQDYVREGTHHNAIDDAQFQAMVIADCIRRLTA